MSDIKKSSFDHDDVIKMGEGLFFGENAPLLPRDKMLMIDHINHVSEEGGKYNKGVIEAILNISPELWFFQCHFKNDPVMPGCLGLDGMWQLMGFYLAWMGFKGKGRALGVKDLKFTGQILPDNKEVKFIIDIKRLMNMKLVMLIADGTLLVDGKEIYTAKDMRVALFTNDVKM